MKAPIMQPVTGVTRGPSPKSELRKTVRITKFIKRYPTGMRAPIARITPVGSDQAAVPPPCLKRVRRRPFADEDGIARPVSYAGNADRLKCQNPICAADSAAPVSQIRPKRCL